MALCEWLWWMAFVNASCIAVCIWYFFIAFGCCILYNFLFEYLGFLIVNWCMALLCEWLSDCTLVML